MRDKQIKMEIHQVEQFAKAPTQESLHFIIERAGSKDDTLRLTSIEALSSFNQYPEAKTVLIQVAREDSEEEIRQRAIEGLRYFAGEDVGEVVLACLDDPDSLARIEAMETLETLSYSPAVEKISELLIADEDELVRRYAATAIGYLQGKHKTPLLKNRLALERSEHVCLGLVVGLYYLGGEEYLTQISSFLESPDYQVRCATVNHLWYIANQENVEYILWVIKSLSRKEETVAVQSSITAVIEDLEEEYHR